MRISAKAFASSFPSNNWSPSCRSVLLHNPHTEKADVPLLAQLQYQYIASCKAFFRELALFASSFPLCFGCSSNL